jgi:hypothetical protein
MQNKNRIIMRITLGEIINGLESQTKQTTAYRIICDKHH